MSGERIVREIRIDAPIDLVWWVVTDPQQVTRWFSDNAEFELQPGVEGTLTFRGSRKGSRPDASQPELVMSLRVERVEPPRHFSFRWYRRGDADADASSAPLVEITLTEDGEATLLTLVESGLRRSSWSDEENDRYTADHERGWDHHLPLLRELANARVSR